ARLTEFYLWLSVGGILGGLFNAMIAPAVFSSVAEFPIALTAAALVMPPLRVSPPAKDSWRWLVAPPAILAAAVALLLFIFRDALLARGGVALAGLFLAARPFRFGLGAGALFALGVAIPPSEHKPALFQGRSFFGVSRVVVGTNKNVH